MDCCLLSDAEVGRLQHYHLQPNHSEHCHIDSKAAIAGVLDDTYVLIEGRDGRYYVTTSKVYFLRRTRSGYIDTIQRVKSNHIDQIKPIK